MDLFYLLKQNFEKSPIWLTNHGLPVNLRICRIYQVVPCHIDKDSEEYSQTYYEALNQILLTQKYRGSHHNTFYGLEAYGTQ